MSNPNNRILSCAALFLIFASFSHAAIATPLLTPIKPGNEMPLATILNSIEASEGISLIRVSDYNDQFWSWAGDREATVQVVARFAGYDDIFGVIPGTNSGVGGFIPVVSSLSHNGIADNGGPETLLPELSGDFRLAISTPSGQIWSSLATDNIDSWDHMVTWVDANDPQRYFVAFEDLAFPGADGDFNDIVLELNNVVDGPSSVPEPGILALMVLGFAVLGYARRRKGLGLL
ncbi:MAG: PEP-CTERM sorting domain-containing protein [Gallionellaceae bacterium]